MSTIDSRKIAFKGTTNKILQKLIDNYFTTLGGINSQGFFYSSPTSYYFIADSGKIIRTSSLPMGYTEKEPGDYLEDIKNERKFAFLGSRNPEIQKAMVAFFIKLGAANKHNLLCKNSDMYYFIDKANNIENTRILPEAYIFQLGSYLSVMKNPENKIPEYVECIKSKDNTFTVGKIYNWPNPLSDKGARLQITTLDGLLWEFKPSTKEAYDAQNTYLKAIEYTPQVGDYVVMEEAGGWGYSPDNNGCLAVITDVRTREINGIKRPFTVYSISGTLINSITSLPVEFADIPQFDFSEEAVFRQALPHEISNTTPKTEPQQIEEWAEKTYAVGVKGNFGIFSDKSGTLPIGKIFTIRNNNELNKSIGVEESQYWIYKKNLRWAATYEEAEIISKQILDQAFCEKPVKINSSTEEDPLEICRRKYKKGMRVRSALNGRIFSGEFIITVDPSKFYYTGDGVDYFGSKGFLYIDGKFADILEEPKEPHVVVEYPITPEEAFPVKDLKKQIKKVKFEEVHEIKTVEEKLLKKTKSKLFNI